MYVKCTVTPKITWPFFPTWPSFPLNACSTQDRLHILKICHLSLRSRYLLNLCTQVSTEPPPPPMHPYSDCCRGVAALPISGGGTLSDKGIRPPRRGNPVLHAGQQKNMVNWLDLLLPEPSLQNPVLHAGQ